MSDLYEPELRDDESVFEELSINLCNLVVESRTPGINERGYGDGLHCPTIRGPNTHSCDISKIECQNHKILMHQLLLALRENCFEIEVLVFPDCCSDRNVDDKIQNKNYILLERWSVEIVREVAADIEISQLLRAVRSFLHFSQLSAWLSSTQGKSPLNIYYWIKQPNLFATCFLEDTEVHSFPIVKLTDFICAKIDVKYPPRTEYVPIIPCSKHLTLCKYPFKSVASNSVLCKTIRSHKLKKSDICDDEQTLIERNCEAESLRNSTSEDDVTNLNNFMKTLKYPNHQRNPNVSFATEETDFELLSETGSSLVSLQCNNILSKMTSIKTSDPLCKSNTLKKIKLKTPKLKRKISTHDIKTLTDFSKDIPSCLSSQIDVCSRKTKINTLTSFIAPKKKKLLLSEHLPDLNLKTENLISEEIDLNVSDLLSNIGFKTAADEEPACEIAENLKTYYKVKKKNKANGNMTLKSLECKFRTNKELISTYLKKNPSEKELNSSKKKCLKRKFDFQCNTSLVELLKGDCIEKPSIENQNINCDAKRFKDSTVMLPDKFRGHKRAADSYLNSLYAKTKKSKLYKNISHRKTESLLPLEKESSLLHGNTKPLSSNNESANERCRLQPNEMLQDSTRYKHPNSFQNAVHLEAEGCQKSYIRHETDQKAKEHVFYNQRNSNTKLFCSSNESHEYITPRSRKFPKSKRLLWNFEESMLRGCFPVESCVKGFHAEIGASGSFCPSHITLPANVTFYELGNTPHGSSTYVADVPLQNADYYLPKKGAVQVTLFNPSGTVVKMFVLSYDFCNMPPLSHTFMRQKIYFLPLGPSHTEPVSQKWLRYIIHLSFASSKIGKVFLHKEMKIVVLNKTNDDAASELNQEPRELRSFLSVPVNPTFSNL